MAWFPILCACHWLEAFAAGTCSLADCCPASLTSSLTSAMTPWGEDWEAWLAAPIAELLEDWCSADGMRLVLSGRERTGALWKGIDCPLLRLDESTVLAIPLICTYDCRGCCIMNQPWHSLTIGGLSLYDRQTMKPAAAGSDCRGAQLPYSEAILFAALLVDDELESTDQLESCCSSATKSTNYSPSSR